MLKCLRLLLLLCCLGLRPAFLCAQTEATRARAVAPAEVTVTLNEAFFNVLLETVFRDFKAPAYPLSLTGVAKRRTRNPEKTSHALPQCLSEVLVVREATGVKTAVRLSEGVISAPIAFTGSYKPPLGCLRFQGWAETEMTLDFNQPQQTLNLRVTVKKIHLQNVPDLAAGPLRRLVQNSLDERINPLPLLKAEQLAAQMPLAALGGALQLRAREVRPEIVNGALRLHINYEFSRAK